MKLRKNQKPDWYWVTGLHDAQILSVRQTEGESACLELTLDAEGALFDTAVEKILLHHCRILSGDLRKLRGPRIWWMGDSLTGQPGAYRLEAEFECAKGKRFSIVFQFSDARVERKEGHFSLKNPK